MKKIVYNECNLKDKDINRLSRRAKAIIKNSKNQILLACSNNNFHLPGGHLENDETFDECLVRELKEETGVDIPFEEREPILIITHYDKDYPEPGMNSKAVVNYYELVTEVVPNINNIHLTDDEKKGHFKLEYFDEDKILDQLYESIKYCTREGVVNDTIEAVKEYLSRRYK